jgi:hypothetical protein
MQNTLLAVIFILEKLGICALGYIDDTALINDVYQSALVDFCIALSVFKALGLQLSENKLVMPTRRAVWLGVDFNTEKMTMAIPSEKLEKVIDLCLLYVDASSISKKNLRSLLGKLLHITQVLPQIRLFVNRILLVLRAPLDILEISDDMKCDLKWLIKNLRKFNTTALIVNKPRSITDLTLDGVDNICIKFCGQCRFVKEARKQGLKALHVILDLLNVNVMSVSGKIVLIVNRSAAHILVLKNGKSRNKDILSIARKIWYFNTVNNVTLEFDV